MKTIPTLVVALAASLLGDAPVAGPGTGSGTGPSAPPKAGGSAGPTTVSVLKQSSGDWDLPSGNSDGFAASLLALTSTGA